MAAGAGAAEIRGLPVYHRRVSVGAGEEEEEEAPVAVAVEEEVQVAEGVAIAVEAREGEEDGILPFVVETTFMHT